jgi:hypothetical protein
VAAAGSASRNTSGVLTAGLVYLGPTVQPVSRLASIHAVMSRFLIISSPPSKGAVGTASCGKRIPPSHPRAIRTDIRISSNHGERKAPNPLRTLDKRRINDFRSCSLKLLIKAASRLK